MLHDEVREGILETTFNGETKIGAAYHWYGSQNPFTLKYIYASMFHHGHSKPACYLHSWDKPSENPAGKHGSFIGNLTQDECHKLWLQALLTP
jgi:hypothetical protein